MTSDSRGSAGGVNQRILSELVSEIKSRDVDFIVFGGDLVYGAWVSPSEFELQLRTWVQLMKPVYDAGIGVYVCRGNHELGDVWDVEDGAGADPNDNNALSWLNVFGSDAYPKQKLPANGPDAERYMTYSVSHKNAFIVCLDQYAGLGHNFVHSVNQSWLGEQLATNMKPHVFIVGHEPAFRVMHRDCLDVHPLERDTFWLSIKGAGGRTYMCGHDHFYDHASVDDGDGDLSNDIHQYIVGTGGAVPYSWSGPYDGNNGDFVIGGLYHAESYGYILVEIDGLDVTVTWMERSSTILDVPGVYKSKDVWQYRVVPGPVVLSPNGGEKLVAGNTHVIRWKTLEGVQINKVNIKFSSDGGENWIIAGISGNNGSYEWVVPAVDSRTCLVRVTAEDRKVSDQSDGVFTVYQCRQKLKSDLNGDCYVDLLDLAILASEWLGCGNPFDLSCGVE